MAKTITVTKSDAVKGVLLPVVQPGGNAKLEPVRDAEPRECQFGIMDRADRDYLQVALDYGYVVEAGKGRSATAPNNPETAAAEG